MQHHPHILGAATNLLAICLVIIGGLKLTSSSGRSFGDEIAWLAAGLLLISIIFAYFAIRSDQLKPWQYKVVDWTFLGGLLLVAASFLVAAFTF